MNVISSAIVIGFMTVLGGCSTVVEGRYQSVELTTRCGATAVPAQCTLQNENGVWRTQTPNHVVIQRGYGDLEIACESSNFEMHHTRVKSKVSDSHLLNAFNLGTMAIVDVGTGAGYAYPKRVDFNVAQCHLAGRMNDR